MVRINNDIDWTRCFLEQDQCGLDFECEFDIEPESFLLSARDSISTSQLDSDCINAVLNSKLAIDC